MSDYQIKKTTLTFTESEDGKVSALFEVDPPIPQGAKLEDFASPAFMVAYSIVQALLEEGAERKYTDEETTTHFTGMRGLKNE